ncbi:MAG TPA: hypothetical protein H9827_12415 [Candidatus Luteimonas excrementigallinarum]|nr:hypothetical protein [Candidatus Luteimonas excrementigallinarum]
MSFDDLDLMDMHEDLFEEFGVDASVTRAPDSPATVRVVIDRGIERLGEFGQVIGRVDVASFLVSQWEPRQGDVLIWTDRLGTHTKPVESLQENDGFVAKAVLHG